MMRVVNKSKHTILSENVTIADTIFKRIRGLLGRKCFLSGEALIIKPCKSVHTFFMRFPIDVLFIDKHGRVIKAVSNLKPFRFTSTFLNATFCIELPGGIIQATGTSRGDFLSLEF